MEPRKPRRLDLRSALPCLALALPVLLAPGSPGEAGELIRYRTPDGHVGFAGNAGAIPPGAVVLRRETSSREPERAGAGVPSLVELLTGVRRRCEARWPRDAELREHCIHGQSRPALLYRELLLRYAPGTRGRDIVEACEAQWKSDTHPDLAPVVRCANQRHSELVGRHGGDPGVLEAGTGPSPAALEREQKRRHQQERLDALRAEQAEVEREEERGRRLWSPRYHKARRALDAAERKTASIIESMRRRGCRQNTLACGSLGPKLERARAEENEKRRYLESGLVEECRRAGCKPGWLR